jgi:superfamily II DNA or RNA helicase
VDYRNIPWRNSRFDEEELTRHVATQSRARNALEQLDRRGGTRTLAFCVSQRHADFMADLLRQHGRRAVAVHSGPTSAPRAQSLDLDPPFPTRATERSRAAARSAHRPARARSPRGRS